jgi:hypothetical protein
MTRKILGFSTEEFLHCLYGVGHYPTPATGTLHQPTVAGF